MEQLKPVRTVRCYDPTCGCDGCQEDRCEGKSCLHYGMYPLLKVRIMAKWLNEPFTRKEAKDLSKNPPRISEKSKVSCPCGRFSGIVKELAKEGHEYRCPKCGNYNLLCGMLYVRLLDPAVP